LNNFDIERYRKARKDAGAKVATVNKELGTLSHCFNQAVEWGWLNKVPYKVKQEREDNNRIEFLTVDECNRLLNVAFEDPHPQIYLFTAMALHTCMRRSEILSLRVENVHLEKGHVFLPKAKAGARVQPITPQLASLLQEYLAYRDNKSPWLFPCVGALKTKEGHTKWIDKTFQRIVDSAGIADRHVTPHVLRHTAITQLVMAGVDLATIQRISGHKTLAMVMRYTHQTNEHLNNAMGILESVYSGRENVTNLFQKPSSVPKTSPKHMLRLNRDTVNGSAYRGLQTIKKYTWLEAFRTALCEAPSSVLFQLERMA
jgi:integrase